MHSHIGKVRLWATGLRKLSLSLSLRLCSEQTEKNKWKHFQRKNKLYRALFGAGNERWERRAGDFHSRNNENNQWTKCVKSEFMHWHGEQKNKIKYSTKKARNPNFFLFNSEWVFVFRSKLRRCAHTMAQSSQRAAEVLRRGAQNNCGRNQEIKTYGMRM